MSNEAPNELDSAIAALRRDTRWIALPGLALTYVLLLACFLSPLFVVGPWIFAAIWPVIGILQYRVVISGHEAVHWTLCPSKPLNELLGVFGQALVGVNFAAYRLQHLDHHKARDLATDPDGHIYGGIINTPRGLRRTLVWTLGTLTEILIKIRQKGTGGYGTQQKQSPEQVRLRWRHTAYVILAQLLLVFSAGAIVGVHEGAALWSLDLRTEWFRIFGWLVVGYSLLWVGPLFTVAVFLNRSRILVEHGLAMLVAREKGEDFSGLRIPTVDIVPNWLERVVFSPFLFNYHCCHHLFMSVPHYNLPKLRALCQTHGVRGYHEVQGSYITALLRTMSV